MLTRLFQDPAVTLLAVRGVPVRLHASFWLLPLLGAWAGVATGQDARRGGLFMVLFVMLLYVCAGLHELGHIIPARHYGGTIARIRISGMGAFVQVTTHTGLLPSQDLIIALGGPLASALISGVLLLAAWPIWQAQGALVLLERSPSTLLVALAGTNVLLTVFNLLPAFPMDGGRALNAALAGYMRPNDAVQVVAVFGQVVAVALALGMAFLTADTLLRLTAIVTAGVVFLFSNRAGRSSRMA